MPKVNAIVKYCFCRGLARLLLSPSFGEKAIRREDETTMSYSARCLIRCHGTQPPQQKREKIEKSRPAALPPANPEWSSIAPTFTFTFTFWRR